MSKPHSGGVTTISCQNQRCIVAPSVSTIPNTETPVWQACTLCGFRPQVPAAEQVMVAGFFKGKEEFRSGFNAVGIVTDQDFRNFLRLSTHERERFVHSLAPERMNPFEMAVLLDMLQNHIDSAQGEGASKEISEIEVRTIPPPPPSLEEEFCTSPRYLKIDSFDNQRRDRILGLVEEVRHGLGFSNPWIRKYVALWPLHVHIKRFLSARLAVLSGIHEVRASIALLLLAHLDLQPQHSCPLQLIYPSDAVPPALNALLSDYNMFELGPAFLFLGVRSDENLTTLAGSHNFRTQLMAYENLTGLHLTDFQVLMMRHILKQL
ncbi:hypothetical protein C8R43DRAFT_948338 [Mycena crocata]|nr:hypothetical protein C8R43DRAFT_948338 [Mycena crocata]